MLNRSGIRVPPGRLGLPRHLIVDYAREINAARRSRQRRRALARVGLATGIGIGGAGLGLAFVLSSGLLVPLMLVLSGWFWWSVAQLSKK